MAANRVVCVSVFKKSSKGRNTVVKNRIIHAKTDDTFEEILDAISNESNFFVYAGRKHIFQIIPKKKFFPASRMIRFFHMRWTGNRVIFKDGLITIFIYWIVLKISSVRKVSSIVSSSI